MADNLNDRLPNEKRVPLGDPIDLPTPDNDLPLDMTDAANEAQLWMQENAPERLETEDGVIFPQELLGARDAGLEPEEGS